MERINLLRKRMMVYPECAQLNKNMKNQFSSADENSAMSQECTSPLPAESWGDNSESTTHTYFKSIESNSSQPFNETTRPNDSNVSTPLSANSSLYNSSANHSSGRRSGRLRVIGCDLESNSTEQTCVSADSRPSTAESSLFIKERLRDLVRAFTDRAYQVRRRIELPPTPSSIHSLSRASTESALISAPTSAASKRSSKEKTPEIDDKRPKTALLKDVRTDSPSKLKTGEPEDRVIDPQGYLYISWLFIVTVAYSYNCCVIPLRSSFPYQTPANTPIWIALDTICDLIYIVDTFLIEPRVMYLDEGFWIKEYRRTRKNYMNKRQFKVDIVSLIPLEIFYFVLGSNATYLRLPRMLRLHSFQQSFMHLDRAVSSPHGVRVARTLVYMVYLIHINACGYYGFSRWEGLNTNGFTYNNEGNAYVRCFYFATKTATSIGKNPKPENEAELMFMTASWLMGVFVFALLIGQIRDIIATATRAQNDYRKLVDDTLAYLRSIRMSEEMVRRVNMWFAFTWRTQHTLDENGILDALPYKMKTDVAIKVHVHTLSKVSLFADCDEALLRELVLKLRAVIYLPGDLVCRRGEVGKEMYIVKSGRVQVVGDRTGEVLATLQEGSVFGEISLLAIGGANRRTADVRSQGYSNLFVLSKNDLNDALFHYPDAQEMLKKKAQSLMAKNAKRRTCEDDPVIVINNPVTPMDTPRLVNTVISAVSEESGVSSLLRYGPKARSKKEKEKKRKSLKYIEKDQLDNDETIKVIMENSANSTKNSIIYNNSSCQNNDNIDVNTVQQNEFLPNASRDTGHADMILSGEKLLYHHLNRHPKLYRNPQLNGEQQMPPNDVAQKRKFYFQNIQNRVTPTSNFYMNPNRHSFDSLMHSAKQFCKENPKENPFTVGESNVTVHREK